MEKENDNSKTAEFKVLKKGPMQVSGKFVLKSSDDEVLDTGEIIFLCRCGASAKKPFCDGSHLRVGLRD